MTKMMSLRDKEAVYATKEEGETTNNNNTSTTAAAASSSRQWSSGLKNPRIVRVSRTFGGKDRHSKVCTIKGLRDRRIRLSVPTAIQLYDLQDRLGLSQPSKVIDWLLDTTKHDIDKLPPLPPMPGSFMQFQQPIHATSQGYGAPFININSAHQSVDVNEDPSIVVAKLKYWDSSNNSLMRSKQKEIDIDDDQEAIGDPQVSAQNFFPIASGSNNNSSATILPPSTLLSNHPMYNYYYHWDPSSNLSLTQLGSSSLGGDLSSHNNNGNNSSNNNNSSSLPSQLALSSSRAQLFLSPSMTSSSTFPQHTSFTQHHHHHHQVESTNDDIRQFNNRFNLLNNNPFPSSLYSSTSSGLGLKPFPLSMSHLAHLHQSHDHQHRENKDDNDDDGPWKRS